MGGIRERTDGSSWRRGRGGEARLRLRSESRSGCWEVQSVARSSPRDAARLRTGATAASALRVFAEPSEIWSSRGYEAPADEAKGTYLKAKSNYFSQGAVRWPWASCRPGKYSLINITTLTRKMGSREEGRLPV